jgi:hypothetical protein
MMRTDIFGLAPRQHDLFGVEQETLDEPMTVEEIRQELNAAVALLRRSAELPWPTALTLRVITMFPEIAAKLPDDEASEIVACFNVEMERLRLKAA